MSTPDRDRATEFDRADPLAPFLERFAPPPAGVVYFDGNSLGQLPHATREALHRAVDAAGLRAADLDLLIVTSVTGGPCRRLTPG